MVLIVFYGDMHVLYKKNYMEKILLAMDAMHINTQTIEFSCYLSRLTGSRLTGVFLEDLLSEPAFGVSLLTDSRYGYATFGNVMSLSLLRGTMSPDAGADIGVHRLRYALYPHGGDWRAGETVGAAACFNRPFVWAQGKPGEILSRPLVATSASNIVIDTIKPAEDSNGFVVRLYESCGSATKARLTFGVPVKSIHRSNTLEDPLEKLASARDGCDIVLRPFQIMTLRIT